MLPDCAPGCDLKEMVINSTWGWIERVLQLEHDLGPGLLVKAAAPAAATRPRAFFSPTAGCPVTMLHVCTLFRLRSESRPCVSPLQGCSGRGAQSSFAAINWYPTASKRLLNGVPTRAGRGIGTIELSIPC